nr:hypothetical protein [Nitrospirota bacterium]
MQRLEKLFGEWNGGGKSTKGPAILIAFGYCLLVGFALSRHEMWRDEMEAWLIARDSESLRQLLGTLQNEGHPALWYLLLTPLTRLSPAPEAMQVLHLGIATLTVYFVSRYAPLSRLQLMLFPLGFYVLWQYAVVSRDYALGILLLVMFCALYPMRYRLFPLVGLVLMLAAYTHALVLILVTAIGIGLVVDVSGAIAQDRHAFGLVRVRGLVLGFALIALGVVTSFLHLIPDSHYVGPTDSTARDLRSHALAIGVLSFFGVAAFILLLCWLRDRLSFALVWGFGIIGVALYLDASVLGAIAGAPGIKAFALIGLAAHLALLYQMRDRFSLLILYGSGFTGLLVFFSAIFSGGPHHHGMLFVVFFVGYWLERLTRPAGLSPVRNRQSQILDIVVTLVLVSQSLFGMRVMYQDLTAPYSNGKAVAQYIQSHGWQSSPIVGCMDFSAQTVVGYLGIKKIYYPQGERWGSYVVWDQKRRENTGLEHCLQSAQSLGKDVLVVSSYAEEEPLRNFPFDKVAEFKGAMREDENFVLYRSRQWTQ